MPYLENEPGDPPLEHFGRQRPYKGRLFIIVSDAVVIALCFFLFCSIITCDIYTPLFQNGHYFSGVLFAFKLALVASSLNSKYKRIFSLKRGNKG